MCYRTSHLPGPSEDRGERRVLHLGRELVFLYLKFWGGVMLGSGNTESQTSELSLVQSSLFRKSVPGKVN